METRYRRRVCKGNRGPVPQSSLGYDLETVDFSDPALPPGMTAEKVHAGIAVALKQFAERGWESEFVTSGLMKPLCRPWSVS